VKFEVALYGIPRLPWLAKVVGEIEVVVVVAVNAVVVDTAVLIVEKEEDMLEAVGDE